MQQRQNLAAIGQRYTDIVWAAGLFEGEGCITTNHKVPNSRIIIIGMTDQDVMERFVDVMGYGRLLGPYQYVKCKNNKPYWSWQMSKRSEVLRILKMFLPHNCKNLPVSLNPKIGFCNFLIKNCSTEHSFLIELISN